MAGESASMADSTKLTWRVGAFIVTFLAIFAVAFFVIQYLSTSTYFVGVDQNEVAIFQGRPGGFAWNQPVVVKRTGIAIIEVPPEFAADITKGRDEASVDDAQAYVARVRDKITGSTSTSTSTSTTTSTARAVTSTTSAGLGGQIPQGADGEASVTTSTAP